MLDNTSTSVYQATRIVASDTIVFAAITQKEYYDRNHHLLFLKFGKYVFLKFYNDYFVLFILNVTKKQA